MTFDWKGHGVRGLAMLVLAIATGCGDAGDATVGDSVEAASSDSVGPDTTTAVSTAVRGYPTPADSTRRAGTLGPASEGTTLLATLEEWKVTLSDPSVPMGQVTIAVENRGTMPHAFEIVAEHGGRWRSAPIAPGGAIQMSMLLSNATYRVYCPLEDDAGVHADLGMETELVVR
ncbi:MAG: hypothetical protein ACRELX_15640 [Longimicrobiales bacterium]